MIKQSEFLKYSDDFNEEITVIGNIDSDGKFILNADTVKTSDGKEIAEDFARQIAGNQAETKSEAEPVAETPVETPVETRAEAPTPVAESVESQTSDVFEEDYINWDYVDAVTAQRQISVGEYFRSLIELPDMEGFYDREIIGQIKQQQEEEWEKVFTKPAVTEEPVLILPEENTVYPDMPQSEIQTQIQENQII